VALTARDYDVFTGGGGQGPIDRDPFGGDPDHGRGDDDSSSFLERLRRGRLGMGIALASVVMLFVAFAIAFLGRASMGHVRSVSGFTAPDWRPVPLPIPALLLNTFLLLLSGVTMELSRRDYARRMALSPVYAMPGIARDRERRVPWLTLTIVLGSGFLTGQAWAWHRLVQSGVNLTWNPSSSFFFLLTGTHALHLIGGLLALLYAGALALFSASIERRRLVVDVTTLYWHVMGLLWVGLFALLVFAN
jgi:cytochrome c oxidase subunit III